MSVAIKGAENAAGERVTGLISRVGRARTVGMGKPRTGFVLGGQ